MHSLFTRAIACAALLLSAHGVHADRPAPKAKPLHFVVYGDTRDGHETHRKIVALIEQQHPEFILQTGDLVAYGGDPGLWKIYDNITGAMRKHIPLYPARGNHDLGGPGYEQRVTSPFSSGSRLYYSFDRANCHFVSVDSFSPYEPGTPQYEWLQKDLAASQKAAHRFVYFHVPPYSIGTHGSNLPERRVLSPLFVKYHVEIVFNGHEHQYYRTTRSGVTYVVTGGGGAPLYDVFPEHGAITGDKWEKVHHIVVCDVDGAKIKITAIREDGSIIETFHR